MHAGARWPPPPAAAALRALRRTLRRAACDDIIDAVVGVHAQGPSQHSASRSVRLQVVPPCAVQERVGPALIMVPNAGGAQTRRGTANPAGQRAGNGSRSLFMNCISAYFDQGDLCTDCSLTPVALASGISLSPQRQLARTPAAHASNVQVSARNSCRSAAVMPVVQEEKGAGEVDRLERLVPWDFQEELVSLCIRANVLVSLDTGEWRGPGGSMGGQGDPSAPPCIRAPCSHGIASHAAAHALCTLRMRCSTLAHSI